VVTGGNSKLIITKKRAQFIGLFFIAQTSKTLKLAGKLCFNPITKNQLLKKSPIAISPYLCCQLKFRDA